jgi:ABC-2 type transport system ATP-binding protein
MVPDQGQLLQELTVVRREVGGPPAASPPVRPIPPLVVRRLRVVYGPAAAVDDLDLTVEAGTVVGLVGPNGCGKTTTLRAVLGLVEPDAGTIDVQGVRGGTLRARSLVASVPDEPSGLDELSVAELFQLTATLWRAESDFARRSELLLGVFGLRERARSQLVSLSHGQRRLVSVVAAVALDRPLLLVDEATAALDPEAVIALREVVRVAAERGAGVLVATQDLHFAELVCDSVTLLSAGRPVAGGTIAELRRQHSAATLEGVFLAALGVAGRVRELRDALDAL